MRIRPIYQATIRDDEFKVACRITSLQNKKERKKRKKKEKAKRKWKMNKNMYSNTYDWQLLAVTILNHLLHMWRLDKVWFEICISAVEILIKAIVLFFTETLCPRHPRKSHTTGWMTTCSLHSSPAILRGFSPNSFTHLGPMSDVAKSTLPVEWIHVLGTTHLPFEQDLHDFC